MTDIDEKRYQKFKNNYLKPKNKKKISDISVANQHILKFTEEFNKISEVKGQIKLALKFLVKLVGSLIDFN